MSLRKVSKIREVLSFQSRVDNTDSEDTWLSKRIGLLQGANNANATIAATFAVEDIWHSHPLGYHIHPGLNAENGKDTWAQRSRRKEIFEYCPEIKIILPMRLNREKCKTTIGEYFVFLLTSFYRYRRLIETCSAFLTHLRSPNSQSQHIPIRRLTRHTQHGIKDLFILGSILLLEIGTIKQRTTGRFSASRSSGSMTGVL